MKALGTSGPIGGFDRRASIPARLKAVDATQAFLERLDEACELLATGKVSLTNAHTTNRARTNLSELWAHVSVAADELSHKRAGRG